jgi:hypothetical protein
MQLDPFDPPAGCILTGDLADMKQLAPNTWYRWTVRAVGGNIGVEGTFHFRTRTEEATPVSPENMPSTPGG